MKKHITKTLFLFAMVIGLAVTASAQDDTDKKPPPRRDPPKIVVPKPTPRPQPPRNDRDKDKKPPESAAFINNEVDNNLS